MTIAGNAFVAMPVDVDGFGGGEPPLIRFLRFHLPEDAAVLLTDEAAACSVSASGREAVVLPRALRLELAEEFRVNP